MPRVPPPGDGSPVAGHARLQAAISVSPFEGDFEGVAVVGRAMGCVGQQVVTVVVQLVIRAAEVY